MPPGHLLPLTPASSSGAVLRWWWAARLLGSDVFAAHLYSLTHHACATPACPPPRANDAFPLFGTLLFGLFAFYLQLAVTKGNFKFGLNLLIFRVHPMRRGATIMSSFLFNVALILLATTASIQFCATAFALYADGTAVYDIFGNQLTSIMGLKYIYTENIFIYAMLAFMLLTLLFVLIRGPDRWKRTKLEDVYAT